ncbi:ABC transporter permease [Arthrobacter sp. 2MCAF15]|uniref:ABC transporter permease n=1 Tax=Arthrobacter sp. 2MCAF15 TaxID=3232984 RepID=UPI003F92C091
MTTLIAKASDRRQRPPGRPRRSAYIWWLVPSLAAIAVFLLLPVGQLLWRSLSEPAFGLQNYTALFQDGIAVPVLLRTLRMGVSVSLVTMLLAYPYALVLTRVGPRAKAILLAIVLLPYWTSLMARTFSWIILLQKNGPVEQMLSAIGMPGVVLLGTEAGVTIAMCQVLLPFMVLPLYATMSRIDSRLVSAAVSLGARPLTAFRRVYLPLSIPGMVAGGVLVFILSIGFYVTPALIGSPQQAMISQLIGTQINRLLDFGGGGALSMVLIVVTLVLLWLMSLVVRPAAALGLNEERK